MTAHFPPQSALHRARFISLAVWELRSVGFFHYQAAGRVKTRAQGLGQMRFFALLERPPAFWGLLVAGGALLLW